MATYIVSQQQSNNYVGYGISHINYNKKGGKPQKACPLFFVLRTQPVWFGWSN